MLTHNAEALEAGLQYIDKAVKQHGFTREHLKGMTTAKTILDLHVVSEDIRERINGPFAIGIGPMRSGTDRTFAQNLQIFDRGYDWLATTGSRYRLPVFYQLAFELDIHRIREERYADREEEFINDLFGQFYRPILTDTRLARVLRMPDWRMSTGAMIEDGILAERRKAERVEFIEVINHVPDILEGV